MSASDGSKVEVNERKGAVVKRNMGSVDRLLRAFVVAPVLIVLSVSVFGVGSALGIVALVFAGVMVVTSVVGFCPAYTPLGMSTRGGVSTHGHVRPGGRTGSWHSALASRRGLRRVAGR